MSKVTAPIPINKEEACKSTGVPFNAVDPRVDIKDKSWVQSTPAPAPPPQRKVFLQTKPDMKSPNIPSDAHLNPLRGVWSQGSNEQTNAMLAARPSVDDPLIVTPEMYPHPSFIQRKYQDSLKASGVLANFDDDDDEDVGEEEEDAMFDDEVGKAERAQ